MARGSTWPEPPGSPRLSYKDPGIVRFYTHRESDPATGAATETNYEGFSGRARATFEFNRSLAGAEAFFPLRLCGYRRTYPGARDDGPLAIAPVVESEEMGEPVVEAHIV